MGRWATRLVPNHDPDRISRVMDVKWRTIGVDLDGLQKQIAEKAANKASAEQADKEAADQAVAWDKELMRLQALADKTKRDYNQSVNAFRQTQKKEETREFDLNDPEGLRKDRPAREGDDDPRCGPASLQKFDGEDLQKAERDAALRSELLETWRAQQADLDRRRTEAKISEEEYARLMEAQRQAMEELVRSCDEARRTANAMALQRNLEIAAERRAAEEVERAKQKMLDDAEIEFNANDPWLNEHPSTTVNPTGTLRKDNYKGMSAEELKAIQDVRDAQVAAAKARREAAAREEMEYARQMVAVKKAMDEMEQRRRDFMQTQNKNLADFLATQKEEADTKKKTMNETFRNRVTPEYFMQFGTSHR